MSILTKKQNSWYSFIRMPNQNSLLVSCRTENEEEARKLNKKIEDYEIQLKSGKITEDEFKTKIKQN